MSEFNWEGYQNDMCLTMIVRDEAPVIKRCIDSVKNLITSYLICDTGSVDGTPEIVTEHMQELGIPGQVIHKEWVDFGFNRNYVNEMAYNQNMAHNAKYLCWLDADEVFINIATNDYPTAADKPRLLKMLDASEANIFYLITHFGNTRYPRYHFVRNNQFYAWKSPVHEYLHATEKGGGMLIDFIKLWARKEGNSSRNPYRSFEDLVKLLKFVKANPEAKREVFYLAQTYNDVAWFDRALITYIKRGEMEGGSMEERYMSILRAARLYLVYKKDEKKAEEYYLKAYNLLPYRVEAPYDLLVFYKDRQKFLEGYRIVRYYKYPKKIPVMSLFCEVDKWEWRYFWVAAFVCNKLEHHEMAMKCYDAMKRMGRYPKDREAALKSNMNVLRQRILNEEFDFPTFE